MPSREDSINGGKRVIPSKKKGDEMAEWTVRCPACGATNRVPTDEVDLDCGTVSYTRVCESCGHTFSSEQPYWRWLGLKEPPTAEHGSREADDSPGRA